MKNIDFIELFSGANGFRRGFEEAEGFRCVWSNDNNSYASNVTRANYPDHTHIEANIEEVDTSTIPDHTLLTAGFPCQPFSAAGDRRGFQDPRGTLFGEILRVVDAKRPQMLLLENVDGILSHDEGRTFATILWELGRRGYVTEWQVLNSNLFGVPQMRDRVYLVGHLGGEPAGAVLPILGGYPEALPPNREREEPGGCTLH